MYIFTQIFMFMQILMSIYEGQVKHEMLFTANFLYAF